MTDHLEAAQRAGANSPSSPARAWSAVVVLSISLLMIGLDNTILNVTLPTLQASLSASSAQLQWTVDAYLLAFAGLLLAAGNLGDRWGRRRALQAGILIFGAGSLLAALSGTAEALIASRAVMGVGGALIMPSTLSIITNMFTGSRRARAIAVWTAVAGLGIALGPVTGGWLLQHFWWGSIFLVNVPIAVIALPAGALLVPESRDPTAGRPDPVGVLLSIGGLLALVYGLIEAPARGWTGPATLTAFGGAALMLGAFVVWELRTDHPMLQLRLFRDRRFSAASAAIALAFLALFGALFFLTQYLQLVLGYTALQAGARTVPVAAGLIAGAAVSAALAARLSARFTVAAGMLLAAGGLAVLTEVTTGGGYGPVLAALLLAGTGIGLAMAPATDSVMVALPLAKASVGSAMNDTARLVGGAFGVAILGTIISEVYHDHIAATAARLPAPAASSVRDSLQSALHVAANLPSGETLALAARVAFTDAMNSAALVATVVALAAAVVALTLPAAGKPVAAAKRPGDGITGGVANIAGAISDSHGSSMLSNVSVKSLISSSGRLTGPLVQAAVGEPARGRGDVTQRPERCHEVDDSRPLG
jgi:EmrB/QacA subfamily drug resistance transporter